MCKQSARAAHGCHGHSPTHRSFFPGTLKVTRERAAAYHPQHSCQSEDSSSCLSSSHTLLAGSTAEYHLCSSFHIPTQLSHVSQPCCSLAALPIAVILHPSSPHPPFSCKQSICYLALFVLGNSSSCIMSTLHTRSLRPKGHTTATTTATTTTTTIATANRTHTYTTPHHITLHPQYSQHRSLCCPLPYSHFTPQPQ